MPDLKRYRVRLSRCTLSHATVIVEARSQKQATLLAGKMEPEWQDDVAAPEVDAVEVVAEGNDT